MKLRGLFIVGGPHNPTEQWLAELRTDHRRGGAGGSAEQRQNILITPHCAAYGNRMHLRMRDMILRNLRNYVEGKPMENPVRL